MTQTRRSKARGSHEQRRVPLRSSNRRHERAERSPPACRPVRRKCRRSRLRDKRHADRQPPRTNGAAHRFAGLDLHAARARWAPSPANSHPRPPIRRKARIRSMTPDTQQERLRQAGEQPVAFAELRAGGIDFPAAVVSELALNGYAIERVSDLELVDQSRRALVLRAHDPSCCVAASTDRSKRSTVTSATGSTTGTRTRAPTSGPRRPTRSSTQSDATANESTRQHTSRIRAARG